MYDREIVMDSLQKISKAIETILERAAVGAMVRADVGHRNRTGLSRGETPV